MPDYLVDGVIYAGQTVIIAGEPGVGKSFFQYHIAMCIAGGLPVLGRATASGSVLYFDEENSRPDLQQYLRWIWRGLGKPDLDQLQRNLHVEHFALALVANRWQYMAEAARDLKPSLIVVDTVTPCCAIRDENDNAEASLAIRKLRMVRQAAGQNCAMVLLKHSKFSHDPNDRQTIRGAKTWLGEADGVIYHKRMLGRPKGDNLYNSVLVPDKVRAFGLRKEVIIKPSWCGDDTERGIILAAGVLTKPVKLAQVEPPVDEQINIGEAH